MVSFMSSWHDKLELSYANALACWAMVSFSRMTKPEPILLARLKYCCKCLSQKSGSPPHNPYLAPSDYFFFSEIEVTFILQQNSLQKVTWKQLLSNLSMGRNVFFFYHVWLNNLVVRLYKCLNRFGDYAKNVLTNMLLKYFLAFVNNILFLL